MAVKKGEEGLGDGAMHTGWLQENKPTFHYTRKGLDAIEGRFLQRMGLETDDESWASRVDELLAPLHPLMTVLLASEGGSQPALTLWR